MSDPDTSHLPPLTPDPADEEIATFEAERDRMMNEIDTLRNMLLGIQGAVRQGRDELRAAAAAIQRIRPVVYRTTAERDFYDVEQRVDHALRILERLGKAS